MANTEIRNALRLVHEAETAVREALNQPLTERQLDDLTELFKLLVDLDDTLVIIDLNTSIDQLEQKSKGLSELIKKTKQSLEELKHIAVVVDKVAKAIDGLVQAVKILISVGIL